MPYLWEKKREEHEHRGIIVTDGRLIYSASLFQEEAIKEAERFCKVMGLPDFDKEKLQMLATREEQEAAIKRNEVFLGRATGKLVKLRKEFGAEYGFKSMDGVLCSLEEYNDRNLKAGMQTKHAKKALSNKYFAKKQRR